MGTLSLGFWQKVATWFPALLRLESTWFWTFFPSACSDSSSSQPGELLTQSPTKRQDTTLSLKPVVHLSTHGIDSAVLDSLLFPRSIGYRLFYLCFFGLL